MAKRKPSHRSTARTDRPRDGARRRGQALSSGGAGVWLYGVHAVLAALANPNRDCRRLLLSAEAERRDAAALAELARQRPGLPAAQRVERAEIDALLPPGAVHQGLALEVSPLRQPDLESLLAGLAAGRQIIVALDQVTDPHNVGAILRSAAVFGAAAVINTERHAAAETGTLAKAASGGLEQVAYLQVTNLARTLEHLKAAGFWCLGLAGEAEQSLAGADLPERLVLCLGAEGSGLRRLTRSHCDLLLALPAAGALRDLNVSNAAAVALYELLARARG
jgi:23S rRNA (guanosine2251-2'-O)-methyltransferase